jgi:hypothetical protein
MKLQAAGLLLGALCMVSSAEAGIFHHGDSKSDSKSTSSTSKPQAWSITSQKNADEDASRKAGKGQRHNAKYYRPEWGSNWHQIFAPLDQHASHILTDK